LVIGHFCLLRRQLDDGWSVTPHKFLTSLAVKAFDENVLVIVEEVSFAAETGSEQGSETGR